MILVHVAVSVGIALLTVMAGAAALLWLVSRMERKGQQTRVQVMDYLSLDEVEGLR